MIILKKTRILVFIILIIIAIITIPIKSFSIYNHENNLILRTYYISDGDRVTYSYIHSVSKTLITEFWEIRGDYKIYLDRVTYADQGGAGMPEYSYNEENFEYKNGRFEINNYSRAFNEIVVPVEKKYKNHIKLKNRNIDLSNYSSKTSFVKLKIEKKKLFNFLLDKILISQQNLRM